jgi:hypothetical protein
MISISMAAQFPAPDSLRYRGDYIELDAWGYCAGTTVFGPNYCTHLEWSPPDTTLTDASLTSYHIYYSQKDRMDTTLLAVVTDTLYEEVFGLMGALWITAYYSNPEGESGPSNTVYNEELPIGIKEWELPGNRIQFDPESQCVSIPAGPYSCHVRIIDCNGKTVMSGLNQARLCISGLPSGIYIVEATWNGSVQIRRKIMK